MGISDLDLPILGPEHRRIEVGLDEPRDLLAGRPEVLQVDRRAVGARAERVAGEVEVHAPGERVGDDEHRAREVVRPDLVVDPGFEVAIAAENGRDKRVAGRDLFRDRIGQRSGVPDAGRASVADHVEAELLQRIEQTGPLEVGGHDLRARGETRLDVGRDLQPELDRPLRDQSRADHHRRVRSVGAARDRRDDDIAVADRSLRRTVRGSRMGLPVGSERRAERLRSLVQRNGFGRVLRSGDGRHDLREIDRERAVEVELTARARPPEPLEPGVRLNRMEMRLVPTRAAQVIDRGLVDREDRRRRSELRAHVRDRGPVGDRELADPGSEELDELVDDPLLAEPARDRQDDVGRGDSVREPAGELDADHLGVAEEVRFAEHDRLGLDPPDPPAEHGEAVDHRRVGIRADQRVRIRDPLPVRAGRGDDRCEVLEIDLMADAVPRGHDAHVPIGPLRPPEESVALPVALVLPVEVDRERARRAVAIDLDRVVDDQVDRYDGVDLRGRDTGPVRGAAQGRKIDQHGHAGEVLQQDAARVERHFGVRRQRPPLGERAHQPGVGALRIEAAEQVL